MPAVEPFRWKRLMPRLLPECKTSDVCACGHLRSDHVHARQTCLVVTHPEMTNTKLRFCGCAYFIQE